MVFKFVQNLFDKVGNYFKDKQYLPNTDYDVILHIGEEPNYKKFYAHSVILKINSKYFESALSDRWINKEDDYFILHITNISPNVFEIILRFIYTETITSDKSIPPSLLFDVLLAADELCLDTLVEYIQDLLCNVNSKSCSKFLLDNLLRIYHIINCYEFEHFLILQSHIKMLIENYPTQIFTSNYFLELPEKILLSCLKNDRLNLYEIDIWNRVLEWGIRQSSRKFNRSDSIECWTTEYFMELEERLKNCIPLIRFHHIKSEAFYNYVVPYQAIIPDHIYSKILKYHLTSELLPLPFYDISSIRSPDFYGSKATLKNTLNNTLKFLDSDKYLGYCWSYLGYLWSRIYAKKLHCIIEFSLFLFMCVLFIWVAIFAIHIFMWLIIAFTIKLTFRKIIDYMNIENRIFLFYYL